MSNQNNEIDFTAFLKPNKTATDTDTTPEPVREPVRAERAWPSRQVIEEPVEAAEEVKQDQVSITGPKTIIDAFKASAKVGRGRVPYYDRLETLMAIEARLREVGRSDRSDPIDTLEDLIERAGLGD